MSEHGFDYNIVRYIPIDQETAEELAVRAGDFFVSRGNGSLALVGRGTLAQSPPCQVVYPDTMIRVRLHDGIKETRWVPTIWSALPVRQQIETRAKTTAGIWKISQSDLAVITILLPPVAEQMRIVAQVEELLARADAARERLARVPAILKRFRQSVLAAACSGRLTADWRDGQQNGELAVQLLRHILKERFDHGHEVEITRFLRRNEEFGEIPGSWCWSSIAEVTENFDGRRIPVKSADRAKRRGQYPYYGASGVIDSIDEYLFDGEYLLVGEDGANLE
jgi:hypothetical protein